MGDEEKGVLIVLKEDLLIEGDVLRTEQATGPNS
jgi:hypothetical protein